MKRSNDAGTEAEFPDVTRQDARVAMISPWGSGTDEPGLPLRARRENPAGLLSLTRFRTVSPDRDRDLWYAQWTDDEACLRWLDDGDAPPARYLLHLSYRPPTDQGAPTLLATPRFACDGRVSQQRLAGTILANLTALAPPGLVGAHLHLSVDGSRLVNYAEWTEEAAWRAFVGGPAAERMRSAFDTLDGVALLNSPRGVARYRLDGS
ncbi:hypothetical protein [Streptomyces sp. NPDC005438]|uniref:hypothetical protein n=1 Tax=Streptomyces sp. NPDC005438 TaxID=3156880 RepID=UPI0033A3A437